jgi:anti-sigma B factor antagonist
MEVAIEKTTANGVDIVHVDGELDLYTAPRFKDALNEVIAAGPSSLVVDLTGVGFLDSTALGVLLGSLKTLRAQGGRGSISLVVDDPHVSKVLRITGFEGLFDIHESVGEALAVNAARL